MQRPEKSAAPELPGLKLVSHERVPVRTRQNAVTRAAWRLELAGDGGRGAVIALEGGTGEVHHRGEGACLGWSQERLGATYRTLTADAADKPDFETPQQLG